MSCTKIQVEIGYLHMSNVCNEQAVSIPFIACQADGSSTRAGIYGSVIDAEIDLTVVGVDKSSALSCGLRLVGDIAVRGILWEAQHMYTIKWRGVGLTLPV